MIILRWLYKRLCISVKFTFTEYMPVLYDIFLLTKLAIRRGRDKALEQRANETLPVLLDEVLQGKHDVR